MLLYHSERKEQVVRMLQDNEKDCVTELVFFTYMEVLLWIILFIAFR